MTDPTTTTHRSLDDLIASLPEVEQESMEDCLPLAALLAGVMHLDGARAGGGDISQALALLGLRLVSVDDDSSGLAAFTRFKAVTEAAHCGCGSTWARLRDFHDSGAGWWHQDRGGSFTRKCPDGERRIIGPDGEA